LRTSDAPEWSEVRERLEAEGVKVSQAILASWHSSGSRSSGGIVGTPDGRVFDFDVVYGYDRSGRAVDKHVGWLQSWDERTAHARITERWKLPNIYLQAVIMARRLLEDDVPEPPRE
jgi:hypothetical protein